jgi:hypothetical protein
VGSRTRWWRGRGRRRPRVGGLAQGLKRWSASLLLLLRRRCGGGASGGGRTGSGTGARPGGGGGGGGGGRWNWACSVEGGGRSVWFNPCIYAHLIHPFLVWVEGD